MTETIVNPFNQLGEEERNKIVSSLGAMLDRSFVKQRKQSNFQLSYIEGWYAIDKANQIFGFDNWSMEFDFLKPVFEREQEDLERNSNKKVIRWHVSYIAQCRITVMGVVRVDTGSGHGIDRECGLAHESASKEAATDAMKRAFRTFGNPFGLALYDKAQEMVSEDPTELLISDDMLFEKNILDNLNTGRVTDLGVRTLCKVFSAEKPRQIQGKYRRAALGIIADNEKVKYLNQGMNSKGEIIIDDPKPSQTIQELKDKVKSIMPQAEEKVEKVVEKTEEQIAEEEMG
jgi:DNA recombination protein Rad52